MSVAVRAPLETHRKMPSADSTNTATILFEERTLRPESLRFESEPWTPFYLAGEILRESRKASGKQSKYASEGSAPDSQAVRGCWKKQ